MRTILSLVAAAGLVLPGCAGASKHAAAVAWKPWSEAVFERARSEKKLVLLDLEAVWCHWCHVMDETTYRDPEVARLLAQNYIAVQVDQDSRPDLSNRYEEYGWPATIVFRADGVELAKRSGYIAPKQMAAMLQAFVDDPTPGPSAEASAAAAPSEGTSLAADLRTELDAQHVAQFDREHAGWGTSHKFLDPASVEYAIARRGEDPGSELMAKRTLDAALALIDPVWGGVYQYSTGGDWKEPHFEKIMSFQADDLRIYALAHAAFGDARYRDAAQAIHRFLTEFLKTQEGAFQTSMDADLVPGEHSAEYFALPDADRRRRGIPRVDTHVYARENGWAIRGLAALYAYAGDETALAEARRAAAWILAHRALEGGGYRHGESDAAGPYFGDTLAMGQAFLALYEATAERDYLVHAVEAAAFLAAKFEHPDAGFVTAAGAPRNRGENVDAARFGNLLFRFTGKEEHRALAQRALRFLATPEVARKPFPAAVLLADREIASEPLHVVVVGRKADSRAAALFRAALAIPSTYRRIEWWDPVEGPLPNQDVEYPELARPAAFACAGGRCSSPAYEPEDVRKRAEALAH